MTINGIAVDTQLVAAGLYNIICDKGQSHIVSFGMIPKDIMDLVETQLRAKIISCAAKQMECTVEEFAPYVDNKKVDSMCNEFIRQISVDIFGVAKRNGAMRV